MNILLIRLRLIGDVVFTTPLIRALNRVFPAARLTYLVEPEAAPVVARNPHLDELIVVAKSKGFQRLRDDLALARRLRAARFDVVIDLHGGPRSSLLARATGAPQRIGYDVTGRSWLYSRTVHRKPGLHPRHSVANQWDLLDAIEGWPGGDPDPARDAVEMPLDPAVDARIAAQLQGAGVDATHALVVIHVSAGNPFRRWPEPSFIRLIVGLASADARRRIVLSSGPSDRAAAARIAEAARTELGARAHQVVDIGEFDLVQLRSLVDRCALFIGGDTGPLHVAATTMAPIVGIYGPTLVERSAPWRDPRAISEAVQVTGLPCRPCDQRVCEPGDYRCLTTLTPDSVMAAAERALKRSA